MKKKIVRCPKCGKGLTYVKTLEDGIRQGRCATDGYLTAQETEEAFRKAEK